MLSVHYISMYRFLSFFCCSNFISAFQNTKRPKIFPLFLFGSFVFGLLNLLVNLLFENPQKYFTFFVLSCLSKIENSKIFCVLLWFCKVCCRVQQSKAAPLE